MEKIISLLGKWSPLECSKEIPFQIQVEELTSGVINRVFRIRDVVNNKSVVVKYFIKETGENEIKAVQHFSNFSPYLFPVLHYVDPANHFYVMEDLENYQLLREVLLQGKILPQFSQTIYSFLRDQSNTTNLSFPHTAGTKIKQKHMTEYLANLDWKKLHDLNIGDEYQLIQKLQRQLFQVYQKEQEVVLHGDFHTSSLLTDLDGKFKLIDLEFACKGPASFDVAMLLADLHVSMRFHQVKRKNLSVFIAWLEKESRTIEERWKELYPNAYKHHALLGFYLLILLTRIAGTYEILELQCLSQKDRQQLEKRIAADIKMVLASFNHNRVEI